MNPPTGRPSKPTKPPDPKAKWKIWWKRADLTFRNCLEFVVFVYVLGFLPLSLHFIVSLTYRPQDWNWVPAEMWLFVMVTCGAAFGDSWKMRRQNDGTLTFVVICLGSLGAVIGALAYALIMLQPTFLANFTGIFQNNVRWLAIVIGLLYLVYRGPDLYRDACDETEKVMVTSAKNLRRTKR
jgi:hypothetical protein